MHVRWTSGGPAYSWVVVAVVVALVATGGALRLFIRAAEERIRATDFAASDPSDTTPQDSFNSSQDAGADLADLPEANIGESAEPAPGPIVIRFELDRSVRLTHFLEEAGL